MRTGVILANTGTPLAPTPEAVKAYLSEFLTNPRIRPMAALPWSIILNLFILPKRKVVSAEKYAAVWTDEGSPLLVLQERLARKLELAYEGEGRDVRVLSAMSFGEPSIPAAIRQLEEEGCERLVVLPMYPQSAYSTTKIVEDAVREHAGQSDLARDAAVIDGYAGNAKYLDAIAGSIRAAGFDPASDSLMLSFHSIPLVDIEAGDTYDKQVAATVKEVCERLGAKDGCAVGFQSRFDKERTWISPFSAQILKQQAEDDSVKRLFFACPNFSIDCLETLYDVKLLAEPKFCAAKGSDDAFEYAPCLNDSDAHVEVCRDVLEAYL